MAYFAPPGATETIKQFKLRLYGVLRAMTATMEETTEMRIKRKYPATLWERVWKNLHAAEAPDSVKSTWYQAIHDILPTNERLAAIGLTDTVLYVHCGNLDSLQHRIMSCGEGPVIWHWTRTRIAAILRMDPPTDTRGVDSASGFPILASSKTDSSHMDPSSPGCLQPAVIETPFVA